MDIRQATMGDFARVREIYADARAYMRENGNPDQWGDGYPSDDLIRADIAAGHCHVCVDGGEIVGVFCFFVGEEPTYLHIYEGNWQNEVPYGVIHRIAVAKHQKGVASRCFEYGFSRCGNLKIDTHRSNIPMQRSLAKNGFVRCGIIYLANGDERIAYQKTAEIFC